MARNKRGSTLQAMSVLQRLREEVGLTQQELAKLIPDRSGMKSISQRSISGWETGECQPQLTLSQIKALCRALHKSLEELPDDLGPPVK